MKLKLSRYCLYATIPLVHTVPLLHMAIPLLHMKIHLLHMTITSPLKIRNNLLRLHTIFSLFTFKVYNIYNFFLIYSIYISSVSLHKVYINCCVLNWDSGCRVLGSSSTSDVAGPPPSLSTGVLTLSLARIWPEFSFAPIPATRSPLLARLLTLMRHYRI
jgi:hypothetical protein